jgi:hypothetical protein
MSIRENFEPDGIIYRCTGESLLHILKRILLLLVTCIYSFPEFSNLLSAMALRFLFSAFGFASVVTSAPTFSNSRIYETEHMSKAELYNVTRTIDLKVLAAFGCIGQSCLAADFAGSSGRPPSARPVGGSDADMACIAHYNPGVAEMVKQRNGKLPNGPKQDTGISTMLMSGLNSIWRPLVQMTGSTDKVNLTFKIFPIT